MMRLIEKQQVTLPSHVCGIAPLNEEHFIAVDDETSLDATNKLLQDLATRGLVINDDHRRRAPAIATVSRLGGFHISRALRQT